ncbi:hypothetical protein RsTz2092_01780 [Deferribacterales bacterium RsTz2092]|nr:hypothetical protein AGMMS49941_00230 [Deferribacterales bacterium]
MNVSFSYQLWFFTKATLALTLTLIVLWRFAFMLPLTVLASSLIVSALVGAAGGVLFLKKMRGCTHFIAILIFLVYTFSFATFSWFTAWNIERSLTYNMLFHAADNGGKVLKGDVDKMLSNEEFYDRFRYRELAGRNLIEKTADGEYVITAKGKVFVAIELALGKVWNLENWYYTWKNKETTLNN